MKCKTQFPILYVRVGSCYFFEKGVRKTANIFQFAVVTEMYFDREVTAKKTSSWSIIPGGFDAVIETPDGATKTVGFSFQDLEGGEEADDKRRVGCILRNPNEEENFPGRNALTVEDLRHITEINDIGMFARYKKDVKLQKILRIAFVLESGEEIEVSQEVLENFNRRLC